MEFSISPHPVYNIPRKVVVDALNECNWSSRTVMINFLVKHPEESKMADYNKLYTMSKELYFDKVSGVVVLDPTAEQIENQDVIAEVDYWIYQILVAGAPLKPMIQEGVANLDSIGYFNL